MISLRNLKVRRNRGLITRVIIALLMVSSITIPPATTNKVEAQTSCRTASALSIQQITQAFVTRSGLTNYLVRFNIRSPHTMFCDSDVFVVCNRDKYAFKAPDSSNVNNLSAGGTCNEFFTFTTNPSNPGTWSLAFKVRFQENINANPNGNPKRKSAVLNFDVPNFPALTIGGGEVEVTGNLQDLPDDGSDN